MRTKSKKRKVSKAEKKINLVLTSLKVSTDEEIANKMYYSGLNTKGKMTHEYVLKPNLKTAHNFTSTYRCVENDSILDILKAIVRYKAL